MVQKIIETEDEGCLISISEEFEPVILTQNTFKGLCRGIGGSASDLGKYWSDASRFPFKKSIIFIDDADFIKSKEFSVFYSCDHFNYYVFVNRAKIQNLPYSIRDVYEMYAEGKYHYLRPKYSLQRSTSNSKIYCVLVEGIGSDYIFFKNLYDGFKVINPSTDGIGTGGKGNLVSYIQRNTGSLHGTPLYLIIDVCGFGSTMEDLLSACNELGIDAEFDIEYESFEYFLLVSNMFSVSGEDLISYLEENCLEYPNSEVAYEKYLSEMSEGYPYKYSKSSKLFPVCYYQDCCNNMKNKGTCNKRMLFVGKDKHVEMLKGTQFENFLKLRDRLVTI